MNTEEKVMNLLGIAERAGRVASGGFATEQALTKGQAKFLIIAKDASADTQTNFALLAQKYKIPMVNLGTKERLGRSLGKDYRAVAAVLDKGFSDALQKLLPIEK